MKKIVLSVILTISTYCLIGQTNSYHPFPDSNAYWIESYWWTDYMLHFNDHNIFISGDTTIGNYSYHKLYKNGWISSFNPPNPSPPPVYYPPVYWGGFRQDIPNKRIYLLMVGGQDLLAYDFNLNIGDSACFPAIGCGGTVLSIDSVRVGDNYNKRFWLSENNVCLIEGVGSSYGSFANLGFPFESGSTLYCLKENNQNAWAADTAIECNIITSLEKQKNFGNPSIFPNPFSNTATINIGKNLNNGTIEIYNSLGQKIKTINHISGSVIQINHDNLPDGVYFLILTQDNTTIWTLKAILKN